MSSLRDSYYRLTDLGNSINIILTDNGDPLTGSSDLNVNGAGAPVDFYYQPAIDEVAYIRRVDLTLGDNGVPELNGYGDKSDPLTNGIVFFIEKDGVRRNLGLPIKTNRYLVLASDFFSIIEFASPERLISYSSVFKALDEEIFIDGSKNERIGVTVQDNLTSLVSHESMVKGTVKLINV